MHKGLILLSKMLINNRFIFKKLSELTLQFRFCNFPASNKVGLKKSQVSQDFFTFTGDNDCQY